jgi:transposase
VYNHIHCKRKATGEGQNKGNITQYKNKTVCVSCTARTVVVSIFRFFFCLFTLCSASVNVLQIVFSNSSYEAVEKQEMSDFQTRQIFGARFAAAYVNETALLGVSRAVVFKVMTAYTNHGKTSSAERNSGRKPKLSERDRRKMKWFVSKNHRSTAAKVTAELNIHLEGPVSTKTTRRELQRSSIHGRVAIAEPLITQNNAKSEKDGVFIIKPGCLMIGNM